MSTLTAPDLATRAADLPAPNWSWRITWRGQTWTDNDLTGQHIAVLSILRSDDNWRDLDMEGALADAKASVVDGYMRLVNMVVALVSVQRAPEGTADEQATRITTEVISEVGKAPVSEILGAFSVNR